MCHGFAVPNGAAGSWGLRARALLSGSMKCGWWEACFGATASFLRERGDANGYWLWVDTRESGDVVSEFSAPFV